MYSNKEIKMERNKRTKIILIIVLTVIAAILLIYVILGYKQHRYNQEHIHPNDVTMWTCKEINMKITYDNNSEIKSAYNGEFNFKNEREFELKIIDNKFLPDDIKNLTFEEK